MKADIWVSKDDGDDENGDGSRDNPYATIEKALTVAYDKGSTIHMLKGDYVFNKMITISNSISIVGEEDGVIFNGNSSKYFTVNSNSELTLKNIIFANAKSRQMIYDSGVLTIDNCIFENNTGSSSQFLIYVNEAELNVYNSIFRNNDVEVTGSNLNTGILIYAVGDVRFENTSFYNNTCPATDGLIYLENIVSYPPPNYRMRWTDFSASFVNCTFEDNTQPAIRIHNMDMLIKDSVFTNQIGEYVILSGIKSSWTSPPKVYLLNITNSNFTFNDVGVAVVEVDGGNVNIENNVFSDNAGCIVYAGTVSSNSPSYDLTIKDNVLSNNTENTYGNYIYTRGYYNIRGSNFILTFNNNESTSVVGNEIVLNATLSDVDGNIINGLSITFTLNETTVSSADIIDGIAVLKKFTQGYGKFVVSGFPSSPVFDENDLVIKTAEMEVIPIEHKIIYVDLFGNDITGNGSEDNPYASLSRALKDVNGINNTIYIKPGVYSGESNNNNHIYFPADSYLEIIGLPEFGDKVIFSNLSEGFLDLGIDSTGIASTRINYLVKDICIEDSTFDSEPVISCSLSNIIIDNITFINSTVCGLARGAVNATVLNVDVDLNGGAGSFVMGRDYVKLVNCSVRNSASGYNDFISGKYCEIVNSTFDSIILNVNSISLISSQGHVKIVNSTFTNITACYLVSTNLNTYYGVEYADLDNCICNSIFDSNSLGNSVFAIRGTDSRFKDLTISNCVILNTTQGYVTDTYIFVENGDSHIDAYDNWFGNNQIVLNHNVKLNYIMTKWVIANVNASDIFVYEVATFDIYFTSNDGSELECIIPTRLIEFILGNNVETYELSNNKVTVAYIPEIDGELTIKVDEQEFIFNVEKGNLEVLANDEIKYSSVIDYLVSLESGNKSADNITFTITVGDVEFANVTTNEYGLVVLDLSGFETGEYEVTYDIPETLKYAAASGNYTLTINKAVPEISVENVTEDMIEINVPKDITENLYVVIDNEEYEVLINNTVATVDISDLKPGKHTGVIYYPGDDNYEYVFVVVTFVISKEDPDLSIDVANDTITIELPEDATGYLLVDVEGNGYYAPIENGVASVKVIGLDAGTYDAVITYSGDDIYNSVNATAEVTVPEVELLDADLSMDINGTVISLSINENATGQVILGVGGIAFVFDARDLAPVDVSEYLSSGTYFVGVEYSGDDVFAEDVIIGGIVVVPEIELLDPELEVSVLNTTIYVGINENVTGVIIIGVGEYALAYDAEDAPFIVDMSDFAPDTYDVIVTYLGDDVFASANATATVTVPEIEPEDANLTATAENATITVSVNPEATGNVLVDVDGTGYYAPVKDGQATINVIGLDEGEYEATVTYTGDDVFAAANATVAVTVPPSGKNDTPVDPQADINISEDGINVELPEDATGYVLVDVDGETSWAPVENGTASFELPELAPGNHTVSVTYTGDRKYDSANATKTITIEGPSETIFSEDLVKVEKAPDRFEANFTDAEGNPLANATVTFEINGNVYTRTTDANGKAGMNINLEAGNYTVIITNPVTGEVKNNTITILPRFEDTNDLVKYFRNDSQYVIKVLGDDGKIAPAGTVVTFNINGVFYNRTVNETGQVKLSINLNPGDYIITAEYKGCRVSNNITVLPVLTGNDLTKKYGEAGAYEATLVDGQGKAYANQTVEFNINGVFYKRTTDSNGVAKLNINLMPGKYIITATYGEAATSNNVTVMA